MSDICGRHIDSAAGIIPDIRINASWDSSRAAFNLRRYSGDGLNDVKAVEPFRFDPDWRRPGSWRVRAGE
jgi:hypothetical protein